MLHVIRKKSKKTQAEREEILKRRKISSGQLQDRLRGAIHIKIYARMSKNKQMRQSERDMIKKKRAYSVYTHTLNAIYN